MKLLLNECVTRYWKRDLIGHQVKTAREAGFAGLKNTELLRAAENDFDVLEHLKPLVPRSLEAVTPLQPGTFVLVEANTCGSITRVESCRYHFRRPKGERPTIVGGLKKDGGYGT